MGAGRGVSAAESRPGSAHAARLAGGAQGVAVLYARRLSMAPAPAGGPDMGERAVLLRQVDGRWHPRADAARVGAASTPAGGAPRAPDGGDHRQPKRQEHRSRRGAWLGWGEKRCGAASATWWSIRKGSC